MGEPTRQKRFEIKESQIFYGLKQIGFGIGLNYQQEPEYTDWYVWINFWKWSVSIVILRQEIKRKPPNH